jgi:hypothetical protein
MPDDITATTGIAPKQGTSYFHGLLGLINDRRLQGDLSGIADRYNEDYGEGASADDGSFSVSARDPQGNPYWEEAQEAMRERGNRPNNIFDLIKGFMQ